MLAYTSRVVWNVDYARGIDRLLINSMLAADIDDLAGWQIGSVGVVECVGIGEGCTAVSGIV